jgi:hypothetical protein
MSVIAQMEPAVVEFDGLQPSTSEKRMVERVARTAAAAPRLDLRRSRAWRASDGYVLTD